MSEDKNTINLQINNFNSFYRIINNQSQRKEFLCRKQYRPKRVQIDPEVIEVIDLENINNKNNFNSSNITRFINNNYKNEEEVCTVIKNDNNCHNTNYTIENLAEDNKVKIKASLTARKTTMNKVEDIEIFALLGYVEDDTVGSNCKKQVARKSANGKNLFPYNNNNNDFTYNNNQQVHKITQINFGLSGRWNKINQKFCRNLVRRIGLKFFNEPVVEKLKVHNRKGEEYCDIEWVNNVDNAPFPKWKVC
jgi:hypothetical protein